MVLAHERGGIDQVVTEALLERRLAADPKVAAAADRLLGQGAPWALDLLGAAREAVEAAGDERHQRVFAAWSLCPARASQTQMAKAEGVSPQRIGQMAQAAGRRVRDRVAARPGGLRWAAGAVRGRLGAVTAEDRAARLLAALGASDEMAVGLLLWLAGPYRAVPERPGWLAVEPAAARRATAVCLDTDGGVRPLDEVRAELSDTGIGSGQLEEWLAASGAVVVHDLAVSVARGALRDALERLLDAHAEPCSPALLAGDLNRGGRPEGAISVAAALRHRRFRADGDGLFGLAEWGPSQPPAAPGPSASVSRRSPARPEPARTPPNRALAADRQWLAVEIDRDALRGAASEVTAALAEGLGMRPPQRRTFSSRWGPVSLAYESQAVTRGSVRAVALAAGARLGDTLLLGFSTDGDLAVKVQAAGSQSGRADRESAGTVPFPPELVSGGMS